MWHEMHTASLRGRHRLSDQDPRRIERREYGTGQPFFFIAGSVTTRLHAYDETRTEGTTQSYRQVIGKCHSKPQMKYSRLCIWCHVQPN